MSGSFYETGPNGLWVFVLVTIILGGSAAYISGRAIAQTWRPFWHIPFYVLLLAACVRFFHYALFWEVLLSLKNYLVDFAVLFALALLGYRTARSRQMKSQYGWIAGQRGPLAPQDRADQQA
jgi:hypothetical protein